MLTDAVSGLTILPGHNTSVLVCRLYVSCVAGAGGRVSAPVPPLPVCLVQLVFCFVALEVGQIAEPRRALVPRPPCPGSSGTGEVGAQELEVAVGAKV